MNGHHHFFHFFNNRELNELYISMAIRIFALSLINIFVPIYLLQIGYSLKSVLIFYAVFNFAHAFSVLPASKLAAKFGFKHAILFSVPLLIIVYLALYSIETFNWPLYLIAIIFGINNSLFWMGYHVDFCKFSDGKHRGRQVSMAHTVIRVFQVVGPLIGGLMLTLISFQSVFATVCVLLLASTIPLFYSKDIHEPMRCTARDVFRNQKLRDWLGFAGYGFESAIGLTIWPIFIFFYILNNYTLLGLVSSISLFFSLIVIIMIGKFSDVNRRLVLKIGAVGTAIIWGIKAFVTTTFQVVIVDSFYGVTKTALGIPFTALSYDKAHKNNMVRFIMFRETLINFFKACLFVGLVFISDMIFTFLFGGIGAIMMFFF
ncbi:MFS transporter [Thermoproteota archaeon]